LKFILKACENFISISCSYKNFIYFNLNHNTFYKNFIKLNKFNIFESTYKNLLIKYLSKSKNKIKLNKYILILLLFIINIILIKLKEINILKIKK
jgi:hypothetical protein